MQNPRAWDVFKKRSNELQHSVPLPLSNSNAAKQMRLVIILAILAREIDKHIFQSTYLLSEDSQIRELLARTAVHASEKESFCRSILLSIDPDAHVKSRDTRVQTVVRNVSSALFDLLPENRFQEFRGSLDKVAREAAGVWEPFQRSKKRYEPDFEPLQWGDGEWDPFMFPGDGEDQMLEGFPDSNLLTVFPRISIIDDNGRSPCTVVMQVRRVSRICVSAEQEFGQQIASPPVKRVASARSRRRSMTSHSTKEGNGAFLGGKISSKA